jgi:putative DNA primase/helicase
MAVSMSTAEEFLVVIRAAGLTPPNQIEAGRFHRFPGVGKRNGNTAGWCKLFDDERGGMYGDFSTGTVENWQAARAQPLSPVERMVLRDHVERARAEAEAEREKNHANARERAATLFAKARPADPKHPYLASKGIETHGAHQHGARLIVPMRDTAGVLHSVQVIGASGDKRFFPGGRMTGMYYAIGKPNGLLCISEGFATGSSINEATGHAVAVAFTAGNLDPVARALRAKYPDLRIVVCADDDYCTAGNPGVTKAIEAAAAVDGLVALPDFGSDRPDGATDFNDLAQHLGTEAVARAIRGAGTPEMLRPSSTATTVETGPDGAWPKPQPLTATEDSKPYPLAALPSGIREAVEEVVGFVQCPPALAACSALSALSLAGQGLADVQRAERLEGPVSLYLLAVADSGERKTTCDGHFLRPIRTWEREQGERCGPDLAAYAAALAAWEERRAGLRAKIRKLSEKDKDTTGVERQLADEEENEPIPIRVPNLLHADATPEALAWALARGWPSGGIVSSEAGIVFGGHGMGRDSVMRNLSLLNALWDGTRHRVERRTSDSFTLDGVRLSVGLAAQPETVRQFLEGAKGLARGSGFAARFLIAAPTSTQGARRFKEAPAWRHLPAFADRLRALLDLPVNMEDGSLALPILMLTADARATWIAFHDDVEDELRPGGDMAETKDVASKAADNVARMAALFHIYEHGPTGQIGTPALTAAATIVGWHLYQARAFLGDVAAPRERSNARKLSAWLVDYCRREGLDAVSRRTIQQRGPGAVRGRAALDIVLLELVEAGHVRTMDREVCINPALLEGE